MSGTTTPSAALTVEAIAKQSQHRFKTRSKTADRVLWGILKMAPPAEYRARLDEVMRKFDCDADTLSCFPMAFSLKSGKTGQGLLINLPHKAAHGGPESRDERLTAWFQAAEDLGAKPDRVIMRMGEHASSGFARLIELKAFGSLQWWRDRDVEGHFPGPHALDGEPTTFPTLAFIHGQANAVATLLPESRLTHVDRLWGLAWHRRASQNGDRLLDFLWDLDAPPRDSLVKMAGSRINKKNIHKVLRGAQKLLDAGVDPNDIDDEGLTPLAAALIFMRSPEHLTLIEFLLQAGADPARQPGKQLPGGLIETHDGRTPIEIALDQWERCSITSHMRPIAFGCFEQLVRATSKDKAITVLDERVRELVGKLHERGGREERDRKISNTLQRPGFKDTNAGSTWYQEAARLQEMWMELVTAPETKHRPSGRGVRL